jgi:hypothetical protein
VSTSQVELKRPAWLLVKEAYWRLDTEERAFLSLIRNCAQETDSRQALLLSMADRVQAAKSEFQLLAEPWTSAKSLI